MYMARNYNYSTAAFFLCIYALYKISIKLFIIIIIIIINATSKTQRLILTYTEVNICFVSWTKFSLNNRPSSKALNRQNWKKSNRQSSKLPPH